MTDEQRTIAGVMFEQERPTRVSAETLFQWVIWQYPKKLDKKLIGAVRPPIPQFGWFPALIDPIKKSVMVYAHVAEPLDSPESAAAFFDASA